MTRPRKLPRMVYTSEAIDKMSPEERFLAQDELVRQWAFRRGWTDLQTDAPRQWPGRAVTLTIRECRYTQWSCQQCRRAFQAGDRVQEVKPRPTKTARHWPRLLVCFGCVDRYRAWLANYDAFIENQHYQTFVDPSTLSRSA